MYTSITVCLRMCVICFKHVITMHKFGFYRFGGPEVDTIHEAAANEAWHFIAVTSKAGRTDERTDGPHLYSPPPTKLGGGQLYLIFL